MPTARASMVARMGAVVESTTTEPTAVMAARPVPSPTRALRSGTPAARAERNVRARTMNAITMPGDVALREAVLGAASAPPMFTSRPAALAGPPVSRRAVLADCVTWATGTG